MKKRLHVWSVMLPIAGHVTAEVEAYTEEEAIELADSLYLDQCDVTWEKVGSFSKGNVCYCPKPWSDEAEDLGEVEGDE